MPDSETAKHSRNETEYHIWEERLRERHLEKADLIR